MAGFTGTSRVMLMAFLVYNFCILATFADGDDDEKHDYTIQIASAGLNYKARDYFSGDTGAFIKFFNDSLMVFQANLDLAKDFPADMLLLLVVSQQDPQTNQWSQKISQTHTFCDYIEKNTYFVDNVYKDTNFPKACPIKKGQYSINNMLVDNSEFPKHLEETKWKAEIELVLKDTKQSIFKFFIEAEIVAIDE